MYEVRHEVFIAVMSNVQVFWDWWRLKPSETRWQVK